MEFCVVGFGHTLVHTCVRAYTRACTCLRLESETECRNRSGHVMRVSRGSDTYVHTSVLARVGCGKKRAPVDRKQKAQRSMRQKILLRACTDGSLSVYTLLLTALPPRGLSHPHMIL